MAITTYLELKQAIRDWGKRPDVSDSLIDTFIALTEAELWNGPGVEGPQTEPLRIRGMETRTTGNLSGRTLALPTNYLESRKLRLTGNPSRELTFRTPESLSIKAGSGAPTDYTITDQIEFNRTPDSTYGYELTHYQSLTGLSASNASNAVLDRFPNVYLFGALCHMADWSMNDQMKLKYQALFISSVKSANKTDRKGSYPSAKSMKTESPTP